MKKYIFWIANILLLNSLSPMAQVNLFDPYSWLFDSIRTDITPSYENSGLSISARIEHAFNMHGYQSHDVDFPRLNLNYESRKVNPLQYLSEYENALAALYSPENTYQNFIQQYNLQAGATSGSLFKFEGDVHATNINFACEYWLTDTVRFGYYLPIYNLKASNITATQIDQNGFYEETIQPNILNFLEQETGLNIHDFSHTRIGDSQLLLSWQDTFAEKRDFITGVCCGARIGAHIPTYIKKDEYEDLLLRIPLGFDAWWGVVFGGSIEANLGKYVGVGISADFTKFFGDTKERRIKTDMRQTELLLATKTVTFINPGFKEAFTVYTDFHTANREYMITGAYNYIKQTDSDISIPTAQYASSIAQTTMQRLEAWSIHNAIIQFSKTFETFECAQSTVGGFVKFGFNGERSIVGTTLGLWGSLLF